MLALAADLRMVCAITVSEHPEQIGAQLRAARESAGLGLEDVVFRTRIPRSVLESLEVEDFSAFVSPVYARSFLAQYSGFLNVDAQPWVDALEPGSFMPAGRLHALLDGPELQTLEKSPPADHRGGVISVLGLLTLSSALVVGAIKGYEFFDVRFGDEGARTGPLQEAAAPAGIPLKPADMKPALQPEDEELAERPPRAIIVR